MEIDTQAEQIEVGSEREAELATLYGGLDEAAGPFPILVESWGEGVEPEGYDDWDRDSELDGQILAGLLRLAP